MKHTETSVKHIGASTVNEWFRKFYEGPFELENAHRRDRP